MHSRARWLLERDYRRLKENPSWGIDARPITEDSFFEWTATICGLNGTDWEGGIFRLYIKFDENYNDIPPKVCFHSIPFHPNVDTITGQPNIDLLMNVSSWKPIYDLRFILISIQKMLSYPRLDRVVNADAAELIQFYPSIYQQTVCHCVAASKLLFDSLHLEAVSETVSLPPITKPAVAPVVETKLSSPAQRRQRIPFEEYYRSWNNIATSKTCPAEVVHSSSPAITASPDPVTAPVSQDKTRKKTRRENIDLKKKIEKINRMRQLYMNQHTSSNLRGPRTTPQTSIMSSHETINDQSNDFKSEAVASKNQSTTQLTPVQDDESRGEISNRTPSYLLSARSPRQTTAAAAAAVNSSAANTMYDGPWKDGDTSAGGVSRDLDQWGDHEEEVSDLVSWTNKLSV